MADSPNTPTMPEMSRRKFAKSAAAALTSAAGLIAVGGGAAFAELGNPDAELLELCRQHDQLSAELDAFYKEQEVAYRRYCAIEPKKPEALRVQKADRGLRLPVPRVYDPTLEKRVLTEWYGWPEMSDLERVPKKRPEAQTRTDEIVSAYRAWDAECHGVAQAVGYDRTDDASDALFDPITPLHDRIIEMPAKTLPGLRAKAMAVAWCYLGVENFLSDEPGGQAIGDRIAFSMVRDLLQLPQEAA